MKKLLIIFCFLLANPALAQEIQDPDIKLSIAELKKKYPAKLVKNIDERMNSNYSAKEIKSSFLNADKNYIGPSKFKGAIDIHNEAQFYVIRTICEKYTTSTKHGEYRLPETPETQRLKSFIFSEKIVNFVSPFLDPTTQECFKKNLIK